ncbi:MAG: CCA tRNA nucleotidyltransferase [Nitrososphaerales archaeon]|nr:CCA tRNA nucleotidyltransferase [Nitrososphaerales archaeon]
MTSTRSVLRHALELVQPSKDEETRLGELAEFLIARTRAAASRHANVKDVMIGGSFAKGTWLPGHVDIDVFVRFDPATPEQEFERVGLAVGAEATRGFPKGKKYAQHPYIEATVRGVKVNVVPCYAVEERKWKSAADRSPFHVKLVEGLPPKQKMQVRLLKRFMRGIGVYGAEIEVQGFSGYAAEALVMLDGDLEGVLKHFAGLKREGDGVLLTLPDPVDPSRDLAKAISNESVGRMVLASREFLRRPAPSFFGEMTEPRRPKMMDRVVAVVFTHPRLSEDTLWGELRRTLKHVAKAVEDRGFRIARATSASNNSDSSAFLFLPEFDSLPVLEQRLGPTVDRRKETEAFMAANWRRANLVWVDGDARVRILQPRRYTDLPKLLEDIASGRLGHVGASDEVGRAMAKKARVLKNGALRRSAASRGWLKSAILEIASDTFGTRPA